MKLNESHCFCRGLNPDDWEPTSSPIDSIPSQMAMFRSQFLETHLAGGLAEVNVEAWLLSTPQCQTLNGNNLNVFGRTTVKSKTMRNRRSGLGSKRPKWLRPLRRPREEQSPWDHAHQPVEGWKPQLCMKRALPKPCNQTVFAQCNTTGPKMPWNSNNYDLRLFGTEPNKKPPV